MDSRQGGKIAAEAAEAGKKKKEESLRKKIPPTKVLGQVGATLTATFLLSLAGKSGTMIGLVGGSALSAVLPTAYDHYLGKSTAAVKARYKELRLTNMEPKAAMRQARREHRERAFRGAHWAVLGVSFAIVLCATATAIAVTEAAAREPVSSLVTGKKGHGSTFISPPRAPAPSYTQSYVPSYTPSAVPVPVSASPSATTTPAVTITPTFYPSPGISGSETVTATPPVPPATASPSSSPAQAASSQEEAHRS